MTLDDFEAWKTRFLKTVKFALLNNAQHMQSDIGPRGARKIHADALAELKTQKMRLAARLGRLKCSEKRQAIDRELELLSKEINRFTTLANGQTRHGPKPIPELVALEIIRVIDLANWEIALLDKLYGFLFAGEFSVWLKASYQKSPRTAAAEWPIRLPTVHQKKPDWASRLKEELLRSITGQRRLKGMLRARKFDDVSSDAFIFPRNLILEIIRKEGTDIFYEELPDVTNPNTKHTLEFCSLPKKISDIDAKELP